MDMDLEGNELSGSLPTQLGALTALKNLLRRDNPLSGVLPTQLEALNTRHLAGCYLGGKNSFSCPTPVEIPLLCTASFQCVLLGGNSSGAVPSEPSSGVGQLKLFLPPR